MPGQVLHKVPLFGWAIFVTAVLLLLALPVLAGRLKHNYVPPALNLAICWKLNYVSWPFFYHEYLFYKWRKDIMNNWQSAENLKYLDIQGILRDYTPESFDYKKYHLLTNFNAFLLKDFNLEENLIEFNTQNKIYSENKRKVYINDDYKLPYNINPSFSSYLAGLIEGDGTIIVPKVERSKKGKLNYPSIQIAFDLRDFPLAMIIQKVLGCGSVSRTKGVNAYRLTINNYEGLILLVNILNGFMRTPKIEMLYLLIKFLNNRFPNLKIIPKEKDVSNLNNNEWLSGFIDADGHFFVNATRSSVSCGFELSQSSINHLGLSKKDIMILISDYLSVPLKTITRKEFSSNNEYKIRTNKLENNLKVVSYLEKFKLYSSKYLNYLDWLLVLNIIKNKKHKTLEGKDKIRLIRDGMNSKRTHFNWDHLQNFYNLYR